MSTATTVGTTSVNVPDNYDFIEPAPCAALSASWWKITSGVGDAARNGRALRKSDR